MDSGVPSPLVFFFVVIWTALGFTIGIAVAESPAKQGQFHRDCIQMAHGTVDGSICQRDGKILFHKK